MVYKPLFPIATKQRKIRQANPGHWDPPLTWPPLTCSPSLLSPKKALHGNVWESPWTLLCYTLWMDKRKKNKQQQNKKTKENRCSRQHFQLATKSRTSTPTLPSNTNITSASVLIWDSVKRGGFHSKVARDRRWELCSSELSLPTVSTQVLQGRQGSQRTMNLLIYMPTLSPLPCCPPRSRMTWSHGNPPGLAENLLGNLHGYLLRHFLQHGALGQVCGFSYPQAPLFGLDKCSAIPQCRLYGRDISRRWAQWLARDYCIAIVVLYLAFP